MPVKKIAKPSRHSTTQPRAAPLIPQQGQQGSGIEPEAYQELLDAGYIIVNRQEALEADWGSRGTPNTDCHNTRSTAYGPGSSDGSVTRHNNTSTEGGGNGGLKQSQDGSLPVPQRPRPTHRSDDASDNGTYGLHEYGSSTTSGRGITSLFSRGFSAGTGDPEVASRRDRTKEEFANTKLKLEGCRKELELSKCDLQRAVGDNRMFSRNIHELQIVNARLKEDLLRSQHELANVQRKFDDATVLADTRGRELQATQAMLTDANSLGRQNSSAYKSDLHFQ